MKTTPDEVRGSVRIWVGVGVVFGLLALAWITLVFFASKYAPADVPLESHATH